MTQPLTALKHDLVDAILACSTTIHNNRTTATVLMHTLTELGELAQEAIIAQGRSYKNPGSDGVIGEAIDLIACIVDFAYVSTQDATRAQALFAAPCQPIEATDLDTLVLTMVGLLDEAGARDQDLLLTTSAENDFVDLCLGLMAQHCPAFTPETVRAIAQTKLAKWQATTKDFSQ